MTTETFLGYRATRDSAGRLTVHDVPIFVECVRGDFEADREWLERAVANAMAAADGGYHAPLHIRHHEMGGDVRPAGWFVVTGTGEIAFQGAQRLAVFADLVLTDPDAQDDVLAARLPYRSVEIFDRDTPNIDSLALLDHEAPYLQLPMLLVSEVTRGGGSGIRSVANATFRNPWVDHAPDPNASVVACFSHGRSAFLLFQDSSSATENMAKTKTPTPSGVSRVVPPTTPANTRRVAMADGPPDDKSDDSEDMMEGDALNGDAIVAAIADGSIPVGVLEQIMAAIEERMISEDAGDEAEPEAAPAMAPGETMRHRSADAILLARQAGEIEALRRRIDERDAAEAVDRDVSTALARLEGRPMGADPQGRLAAYRTAHGAEAFAAYVDSMVEHLPPMRSTDPRASAFTGVGAGTPEVAMAYQDRGPEAVAQASRFAAQYAELRARGGIRASLESYVATCMKAHTAATAPA